MYGEFIVGIHTMFNYVMLSFANRVVDARVSRRKMLFSAFVGALLATLLSPSLIVLIVIVLLMTFIAFGKGVDRWKKTTTVFIIGSLFAGGLLTVYTTQVQSNTANWMVFLFVFLSYLSLTLFRLKWLQVKADQQLATFTATSTLQIWGRKINLTVFVDSGNHCTEPISHAPVHFVSFQAMKEAIPQPLLEPLLQWDAKQPSRFDSFPEPYAKGIRLIRVQTVQGDAWAVGFPYTHWIVGEGTYLRDGYLVLTKQDQRYPAGAQAILHFSALEQMEQERGIVHAT